MTARWGQVAGPGPHDGMNVTFDTHEDVAAFAVVTRGPDGWRASLSVCRGEALPDDDVLAGLLVDLAADLTGAARTGHSP